jgi:hypothetical protein
MQPAEQEKLLHEEDGKHIQMYEYIFLLITFVEAIY